MKKVLPFIGVLIVLSGFIYYTQQMVVDYNKGMEQVETKGTSENAKVMVAKASVLAQRGDTKDAIDLMLKTIEENPKNLQPQLKLAQLYVINCKEHEENCEDALWQLNVILKIDSTNATAKQLLQEIKVYTHPKKPK